MLSVCVVDGWFNRPQLAPVRLITLWMRLDEAGWGCTPVAHEQSTSHHHTHSGGEEGSDMSACNSCSASNHLANSLLNWCVPTLPVSKATQVACGRVCSAATLDTGRVDSLERGCVHFALTFLIKWENTFSVVKYFIQTGVYHNRLYHAVILY